MAQVALELGLHNPCLQNAQQATEKALKAIRAWHGMPLVRTHRIGGLIRGAAAEHHEVQLSAEDCDLIDAIYVSSQYPPESALPVAMADAAICRRCLQVAERSVAAAGAMVEQPWCRCPHRRRCPHGVVPMPSSADDQSRQPTRALALRTGGRGDAATDGG